MQIFKTENLLRNINKRIAFNADHQLLFFLLNSDKEQ